MQQLSALDNAFVSLETGSTHMHISYLAVYDPSTAPEQSIRFKDIINNLKSRLHKLPELRQRYVPVPMGLDYPYWIADPDFDIEFHLRHIALPAPGDWRQLCIQASRLHSRPLDLAHAPWEIYVIEGLNNVEGVPAGSFAMVVKLHHGLFDGQAAGRLIQAMHDTVPVPPASTDMHPLVVDRVPTSAELLAKASVNSAKTLYKTSKIVAKHSLPLAKQTLRKTALKVLGGKKKPSTSNKPPRTRFNAKVSPHRVFEGVEFDFADIKAMRKLLPGVTVNDLAITIVSGGLRRYLEDKVELPEQSLRTCIPVDVSGTDDHDGHNKISFAFNDLHTDITDVKERLVAIHASCAQAKMKSKSGGGTMLMDLSKMIPTPVSTLLARTAARPHIANKLPVLSNTVISNVQGPQIPIYHTGAKMVRFQGLGVPVDLAGLFHVIFSYNGTLGLSFTSCRDMMPDPAFYKECLQASFDELKGAILVQPEKKVEEKPVETAKPAKAKAKPKAKVDKVKAKQPIEIVEQQALSA